MVAGGQRRPLGGPRQRALLATLALHANEVVSVDRIVDSVWGATSPPSARHVVQTYVSQLRPALDGVAALRTQAPGYRLEIEPEHLDAARFEKLVREARAAVDPVRAVELLDESLALWRGEVAEDAPLDGEAALAAQRLEQLRLEALGAARRRHARTRPAPGARARRRAARRGRAATRTIPSTADACPLSQRTGSPRRSPPIAKRGDTSPTSSASSPALSCDSSNDRSSSTTRCSRHRRPGSPRKPPARAGVAARSLWRVSAQGSSAVRLLPLSLGWAAKP